MKIFISYAHEDRVQVSEIKRYLDDEFGFDVFLAHEDIAPTHEWVDEILSELNVCDVFIAFLTENFNKSDWTDQEVGFALARGVKIIPLNARVNPRGFIGRYQALNFRTVISACNEILKIIVETPDLRENILNQLIAVFENSYNFRRAESVFDNLIEFEDKLSSQQKNKIVRLSGINNQIYGSFGAKKGILGFIKRHKGELNNDLVEAFIRSMVE